ncbi:MAG: hypothetical protein HN948_08050 [Clostridia bacterium]|nr:hypothetical protein [Clostridia bacterium]
MTAHAATGMTTELFLFVDGDVAYATTLDSHGVVMPEGTVTTFFNYTFTDDDVGEVEVICHMSYTMMGRSYSTARGTWITFDVLPPLEFDFEAVLSASPTTIDAGDEVTFTTDVTDTGETTLSGIELRNAEGGLIDVLPPIPVGGTRSFVTTAHIFETTDVSYVVICADDFGNSDSQETNTVRITVRDPEEALAPAVTETQTVTTAPAMTPSPPPSSTVQSAESPGEAEQNAAQQEAEPIENLALYIIIGALGLLVIAAAITVPILLHRGKKKATDKRKDTL